uniref:beta-glucosidase n=1 Tax=mine drainage metagenome TaxID=410659 RepID=E6Q043_9ZZZZ
MHKRVDGGLAGILVLACSVGVAASPQPAAQPHLGHRSVPLLHVDGLAFKDMNRNGKLDAYEDWRLSASARADDLVKQMTLAEKAGLMMHGTVVTVHQNASEDYDHAAMAKLIETVGVNSFITRLGGDPGHLAAQNNLLQELAEQTRLGIPVTVSTDPRNHFEYTPGTSVARSEFSQWPETLGLAAIDDPAVVREFGNIARQEYLAVGIDEALSPQADLATEPRWARINGTFGEDAELTRRSVEAYVEGFQDGETGIHPGSVIAVVKHWVGYGGQVNGLDSHNYYGRFAAFPGDNFRYHVLPFTGAFAAHVGAVMPTYSIITGVKVDGEAVEPVGANYSRVLLTDLLRRDYKFDGVILTDWGITNDCDANCLNGTPPGVPATWKGFGTDWGVAELTKTERFAKALHAGVDQFGGTEEAQYVVDAVKSGKVTEARIDESVKRILTEKFEQGLFENAYVDPAAAKTIVGSAAFQAKATEAQEHSLVLLKNAKHVLPIRDTKIRVYLKNIDPKIAASYGFEVVATPAEAQLAILRVQAPYQTLHPGYAMGSRQHEGDLDFKPDNPEYQAIVNASKSVPTIVTVYLDRPAILSNVNDKAAAIVGNFGVSDRALLNVLTGRAKPMGKLPFELPSSMAEVKAQKGDVPHDTAHPLYAFGFGLRY